MLVWKMGLDWPEVERQLLREYPQCDDAACSNGTRVIYRAPSIRVECTNCGALVHEVDR